MFHQPVGLPLGGCVRVPVVLVLLEQNGCEGSSKTLPAVIIQTAVSLHQPSHKEHSSSDLLLHGYNTHTLSDLWLNEPDQIQQL